MRWVPPSIAEVCPESRAELTACSPAGYMYLALITQLFGNSLDDPWQFGPASYEESTIAGPPILIPMTVDIPHYGSYTSEPKDPFSSNPFGPSSIDSPLNVGIIDGNKGPGIRPTKYDIGQTDIGATQYDIGLTGIGPTEDVSKPKSVFKNIDFKRPENHEFNVVHDPQVIKTYSHGVGGSRSVSKTSFFRKKTPTTPEIKFSFETTYRDNPREVERDLKDPFDFSFLRNNFQSDLTKHIDEGFEKTQALGNDRFYYDEGYGIGSYASASTDKKSKIDTTIINNEYRNRTTKEKGQDQEGHETNSYALVSNNEKFKTEHPSVNDENNGKQEEHEYYPQNNTTTFEDKTKNSNYLAKPTTTLHDQESDESTTQTNDKNQIVKSIFKDDSKELSISEEEDCETDNSSSNKNTGTTIHSPKLDKLSTKNSDEFNDEEFYNAQTYESVRIGRKVKYESPVVNERLSQKEKGGKSRRKRQAQQETYDFIVVGAGSAGCVIANRLSEVKGWKILLLEAGDEEPEVASVPALAPVLGQSSIDWRYRTQPENLTCRAQRGQTCAWLRGKVMGGSSVLNYMIYMRGNRRDYDEWAEAGNHGWSYNDVLPYFKKSENNRDIEGHDQTYHGVGGYLNVERFPFIDKNVIMIVDGFKEKGLPLTDFNGEQQIGTMTTQTTSLGGRRFSVNTAFIRPIRHKRPNLTIRTQSEVTKILIDPHTKTAYGVKYLRFGQWQYAYARKEVIVSSGALNSPKLLMLSGIGPHEHIRSLGIEVLQDLKVGYNLHDHVTTDALVFGISNKTSTMISPEQLPQEIYYYYNAKKKNGPLSATGTLYASAFIQTEYSAEGPDIPDIQYHFDGRNLREFYADPTTYLSTNIFPLAFYNSLAARPILLKPKSRGYLKLNATDPVFGPPLIYPRFFTSKVDVDTMIAAMRYAVSLEDTESFRINGASFVRYPVDACRPYRWGSDEYFTCLLTSYTSTIYHPVGTCKMGPHWDPDAVVDPRLNVYGVKNLRVADASIMPTVVRGNTNAPCIMIGEKVSDMIKVDWLKQL